MDFLRDVVREPAYVLASSLSSAYTVKLAAMRPELVARLVLVCPTGLETLKSRLPIAGRAAYAAFSLPAIGPAIYNGITSYNYIESYLRTNLYVDPTRVTPALIEQYYQSAHQPNSHYALRAFLAGLLNCDITDTWPRLAQQILIAWGRYARATPVENAQRFLQENPNTRLNVFENSSMLPHDEEYEAFNDAVITFLSAKDASALLGASGPRPATEHAAVSQQRQP